MRMIGLSFGILMVATAAIAETPKVEVAPENDPARLAVSTLASYYDEHQEEQNMVCASRIIDDVFLVRC